MNIFFFIIAFIVIGVIVVALSWLWRPIGSFLINLVKDLIETLNK